MWCLVLTGKWTWRERKRKEPGRGSLSLPPTVFFVATRVIKMSVDGNEETVEEQDKRQQYGGHQQQQTQQQHEQQQQQHASGRGRGSWKGAPPKLVAGVRCIDGRGDDGRYVGGCGPAVGGRGRGLPSYPPPPAADTIMPDTRRTFPVGLGTSHVRMTLANDARTTASWGT